VRALRAWWLVIHAAGRTTETILAAAYFGAGVSMMIGAPSSVRDVLGGYFHILWAAMLILAPVAVFTGILVKDQWLGTWLRVAGQLSIFGAVTVYLISTYNAFGWGTFAGWTTLGLTAAALASAVRDAVRLRKASRIARGA